MGRLGHLTAPSWKEKQAESFSTNYLRERIKNMTDFVKEGRVGDKIWSIHGGYGEIERLFTKYDHKEYSVRVTFLDNHIEYFTSDGKLYTEDEFPTLFWDKPQIIEPEKPIRKVKRWIAGFYSMTGNVSIYGSNRFPDLYPSEAECPEDSAFKVEVEIDEEYV